MQRPTGMRGFTVIAIGQLLSLTGSAMTGFAIPIWIFQQTGRATDLSLLGFFYIAPLLIISPLAGAIVDRSNRKLMMMLSDLAAGVVTVGLLVLVSADALQLWHLYVANIINGTFQSFQWPAYSAAISTMVKKENYGRANGMLSLTESASGILAPGLAAALLAGVGLVGVLLVDVVTFSFAIVSLLFVHIPEPVRTEENKAGQSNLLNEAAYGFRYILKKPSLLGLQTVFMLGNFGATVAFSIMAALILARTGNNEAIYATVATASALGGVAGGALMSAWGGPKRLIHGVLGGWIIASVLNTMVMGVGRNMIVWAVAAFIGTFLVPVINGSNQAIWQAKVAPDVQGRVFAIRRLIAWLVIPIATLVAGPLADTVFEPALAEGGALVPTVGWLVGAGPGAGIGFMFVLAGFIGVIAGVGGYLFRIVRDVETIMPDHEHTDGPAEDAVPATGETPAEVPA